ncbi:MAG: flavodoxin [Mobilibacterium timonense]|uniref:flavodoxin n=1 Tax=Mobilibacterium timonense TaxID=1871012 RepID=UPI00098640C6|nr:flavodoxin [Mobilibacterium timonense]MBM6991262.1 flavodoxin [Mobilibacterium timonense]
MKKLVAYYSASGVTARKAKDLASEVGADVYEIVPAQKYTSADLDWTNRKSRSTLEMRDPSSRPELAEKTTELSGYDTVYIGFPIWWGVAPRVINTFIENNDLAGKKIGIFATSGGTGISAAIKDLQKKYPDLDICGGKLLNGSVKGDIL